MRCVGCAEGHEGARCERCARGYVGDPTGQKTGECQQIDLSLSLSLSLSS